MVGAMGRKNSDMSKQRANLQSVFGSYRSSREVTGVLQVLWKLFVGRWSYYKSNECCRSHRGYKLQET